MVNLREKVEGDVAHSKSRLVSGVGPPFLNIVIALGSGLSHPYLLDPVVSSEGLVQVLTQDVIFLEKVYTLLGEEDSLDDGGCGEGD